MIRFEWDKWKAAENVRKHDVSFEEASTAFSDPFGRIIYDPDLSQEEDRFVLLGISSSGRTLLVCHCHRANDDVIRITSARKAVRRERKQYGEF